jgi:hypothetical protein
MSQRSIQFAALPTEEAIVAESGRGTGQINRAMAGQMLGLALRWGEGEPERQLQMLNYLCNQVEAEGAAAWPDLRWTILMHCINRLSAQINDTIDVLATRHGARRTPDTAAV